VNALIKWIQKYEQSGVTLVANKVVLGVIRHLMTIGGGYFINQGVMDKSQEEAAIAAVVTLLGVAWSVLVKLSAEQTTDDDAKRTGVVGLVMALIMVGSLMLVSGCATTANDVAMAKIAADTAANYYAQPNNATYMEFEGSNVTFSITGASKLTFSGPIPTKSIYPREEGTLKTVVDGVTDITKTAALGVFGVQAVKAVRAQQPTVVTTEKLVPVTGATP
jgi:hypothetical protein